MDIIDNLRYKWRYGSMLIKLVFVNIAVFIILNIATLILSISGQPAQLALGLVEMPSQLSALAVRPWTVFTYMFSQYDFLHLLFNMVWLYWFGSIFLLADSSKNMCALYIRWLGRSGTVYCRLRGNGHLRTSYRFIGISTCHRHGNSHKTTRL